MSLADMSGRRHFARRFRFLEFLDLSPFEDLQDPLVLTCTLRKWLPRPACGKPLSNLRNSISVSTPVSRVSIATVHHRTPALEQTVSHFMQRRLRPYTRDLSTCVSSRATTGTDPGLDRILLYKKDPAVQTGVQPQTNSLTFWLRKLVCLRSLRIRSVR